jgi:hypothetical protein
MDVLKNFIISEGGNPIGPCDLWHKHESSSKQRTNKVAFVFEDFWG